jgi:hypothetical protein
MAIYPTRRLFLRCVVHVATMNGFYWVGSVCFLKVYLTIEILCIGIGPGLAILEDGYFIALIMEHSVRCEILQELLMQQSGQKCP